MKNWYALYVKSRHEFVTQGELIRKGINAFLPTVKKMHQWKDRKKLVELPLFPGYLFAYLQPHEDGFLSVLRTRGAPSATCRVVEERPLDAGQQAFLDLDQGRCAAAKVLLRP